MTLTDNTTGGRIIVAGFLPVRITLGEACEVGDMIGYSSGWKRALATTGTAIQARLVAGQSGKSGDIIIAYGIAVIDGLTGMTGGSPVYLAEAALYGEVSESAPNTTGDVNCPIGLSIDATTWIAYPIVTYPYSDADNLSA